MPQKKKVLFFGLGSIGQRHLSILKKNFNYEVYAYRTKKENPISDIRNIYNLKEAFQVNPDIAFITNPTYLHIEIALLCLEAGIKNLFIEKPLSDSLNKLDIFDKKVKDLKALVYIGYSMRFNPIIKRLKELIREKKSKIFYAQTICSSYLPNWRPGRDYRTVYSSKKNEGGGVILDLIHEFDYNEWLFGKIKSITGLYGKISKLEIDTEDFCDVSLKFENNMNATIHLDYYSFNNERRLKILTSEQEIIADLINNQISFVNNKEQTKEVFNFQRDDYYEEQLKYFINDVENQSQNINNLKEAIDLLKKLIIFKEKNKMIVF